MDPKSARRALEPCLALSTCSCSYFQSLGLEEDGTGLRPGFPVISPSLSVTPDILKIHPFHCFPPNSSNYSLRALVLYTSSCCFLLLLPSLDIVVSKSPLLFLSPLPSLCSLQKGIISFPGTCLTYATVSQASLCSCNFAQVESTIPCYPPPPILLFTHSHSESLRVPSYRQQPTHFSGSRADSRPGCLCLHPGCVSKQLWDSGCKFPLWGSCLYSGDKETECIAVKGVYDLEGVNPHVTGMEQMNNLYKPTRAATDLVTQRHALSGESGMFFRWEACLIKSLLPQSRVTGSPRC